MANRLASETSPYLRQHAHNPVNWYPWCQDAFERSRTLNLPIFLSIGYSSCHWCHVMEREVFEDREIAEFLNSHMVCIKVDREERPDIDKYFQEVFQVMNSRAGGWPLSIFLTPSMKPVFAATYVPPRSREGVTGFLDLIRMIQNAWMERPTLLEKGGSQVLEYLEALQEEGDGQASAVPPDIGRRFLDQAVSAYDPEYGGFSHAPKFPSASIINLLLVIGRFQGSDMAVKMALHSLECMAAGGLYDLVDGGFCRYSVDEKWLVPHFEKMTYDNGLLCESYFRAWQLSGQKSFLETAVHTARFMLDKMQKNGLFFSSSDADSQGEEGRYFVYSYREVLDALVEEGGFTEEQAREVASALSITKYGNFEGSNIVRLRGKMRPQWLERAMAVLSAIRASRPYPSIDHKVITAWNAMMLKALFFLSRSQDRFREPAIRCADTLFEKMFREGVLYHSSMPDSEPVIRAFLDDYAFLADAMLTAYQETLDSRFLQRAKLLARQAVELFYHEGSWYFSTGDFPVRAKSADSAYPSSAAVMVSALITLGTVEGEPDWLETASKSIEKAASNMISFPLGHAAFVANAVRMQAPDIVIHGEAGSLEKIRPLLGSAGYPFVLLRPEAGEGFRICRGTTCLERLDSPAEAAARVHELMAESN